MPAHKPEELDVLFAQAVNAGDIEAVIKLYEPAASLTPSPARSFPVPKPSAKRSAAFSP